MNIFEESTYRSYLKQRLGNSRQRTGEKMKAAKAISCHTTYLSQVLNDKAELSLEQADLMNTFLGHTKDESEFFILLVLKARAGTVRLKTHFQEQIDSTLAKRVIIKSRINQSTKISLEDESRFYSRWYYGAIHVLVSIPELKTREAIASYLKLPMERVTDFLEFLVQLGLVERQGDHFKHRSQMVHLGNDSSNIVKHHLNWRMRAMRVIEETGASQTHYSAAVSLSRKDAAKIKQVLVDSLKQNLDVIAASKEEVAYGYTFDFFELKG